MARFRLPLVLLFVILLAAGCCSTPDKPPVVVPVVAPVADPVVTPATQEPLAQTLPRDPSAAEPPVIFEMPELMCVAEAEGFAFVLDLPIDVFYYRDVWFWQIREAWYWSKSYMGLLYELTEEQVPAKMLKFGTTYRQDLPDCREFTYDDWYRRVKQR
jgi:hypothetical protein